MENYRLQIRAFSSNIIEKRIIGDNGKEKWIPFVAPFGLKVDGDKVADELLKNLNNVSI